jgi:hypothetical protein
MLGAFILIITTSCMSTSNTKKIQDRKDAISELNANYTENSEKKLEEIAKLSMGTGYALSKVQTPTVEVTTAIDLNERIVNISGNPDIGEVDKIKELVDLLTSSIESNRKIGESKLKEKDSNILALQFELKEIDSKYNKQIELLKNEATLVALKADKFQETVDEVNSYMGLGGVFYGLKKFISNGILIILIFIVIFIILKFAANSNPIAAAVFSIFEYIGGYLIAAIKGIVPNSAKCVNLVESKYKTALTRVVNAVETVKLKNPTRDIPLSEILSLFSSNLNIEDKNVIAQVKQDLKNKI